MIGTEIKKQREKKGFSLKKLSELSGVSDSIISDIEIGKVKNPGIMTVLKIAKGLEVDIAELTNVIEVWLMQLAPTYKDRGGFTMNEMSEKEILEKINSILETAKIIAENNVDMDDFEMEIDISDKV